MSRSHSSLQMPDDHDGDEDDLAWPQLAETRRSSTWGVRRLRSSGRASEVDLRSRLPSRSPYVDEQSSLLEHQHSSGPGRSYTSSAESISTTPRPTQSRRHSNPGSLRLPRSYSRGDSFSQRLVAALSSARGGNHDGGNMEDSIPSLYPDHRVWYDQVGGPGCGRPISRLIKS